MDILACVDQDWGIGYKGDLLYHIEEDMKFFKDLTYGGTVVMGSNTLKSLPNGEPLKGRLNIVLTSKVRKTTMDNEKGNVIYVPNVKSLLKCVKNKGNTYCIGGGKVYEELLPYCNTAYITCIADKKKADTIFPNLDINPSWELNNEVATSKGASHKPQYTFKVYTNMNVKRHFFQLFYK